MKEISSDTVESHGVMMRLRRLGMMTDLAGGVQMDVNASLRKIDGRLVEASLCDHNCTAEVGGYTCPAAASLNSGVLHRFANGKYILEWIRTAAEGVRIARREFLTHDFASYCATYRLSPIVARAVQTLLCEEQVEINLFGGNPEMHGEILTIMSLLKADGYRVNLTTTGRKILLNRGFAEGLVYDPPAVLALSADDLTMKSLPHLLGQDMAELKESWKKIPCDHGQQQKAVEAIYAARYMSEASPSTKVLFNMVVHGGNLRHAWSMIENLMRVFPQALVNPYPHQTAFAGEGGAFATEEDVARFEKFVDHMITISWYRHVGVTKRLHYWLVLKALYVCYGSDWQKIARAIGGYRTWQCYRPGAMRYVQVGRAPHDFAVSDEGVVTGGHLGCFWNTQTITQEDRVQSSAQVVDHIRGGGTRRASTSPHACAGCMMPRLVFDMVSTELGLSEEVREAYLALRQQYAEF